MNTPPPIQPLPPERSVRGASYLNRTAETPDPWELCARLQYGGDRSFASSVEHLVVQTVPNDWPKAEARLLAALALPDATDAGRAFVCRMLALIGSAASVPALANLLLDPKTADAARGALEGIPGPEAVAALRDALTAATDVAKAGLIGTLAARRDAAARPALAALRDAASSSSLVRGTAARALQILPPS
jgi:hypothetical protein